VAGMKRMKNTGFAPHGVYFCKILIQFDNWGHSFFMIQQANQEQKNAER